MGVPCGWSAGLQEIIADSVGKFESASAMFIQVVGMDVRSVTELRSPHPGLSPSPRLVLSIFPGIDLLGRAFEEQGDCVVRGPDLLWGGDVRAFFPPAGSFTGIIGGSPCQDFSAARRSRPTGAGMAMLQEFCRCVECAAPEWFLLENVTQCPDIQPSGYTVQRFFLNARECGSRQHRHRRFQFGSLNGVGLVIPPPIPPLGPAAPTVMATEGGRKRRRSWSEFVQLQGLPASFDLPGLPIGMKYRAVGNGVPLEMGRVLAIAIHRRHVTRNERVCVCECGRVPPANAQHHSATCRKRMERRRRDYARPELAGTVTAERNSIDEN